MYPSDRLLLGNTALSLLQLQKMTMTLAPDFAALFNATPAACMVMAPDFTIIAVNDAHLEATGAVREKIVGRGIFEAFPDNPDHTDADGVSNIRASMLRVLQTKRRDIMPIQRYDVPTQGRPEDGFTMRYWKPIHFPILDHRGEVSYIIQHVENVTQTVTETARAEEMRTEISVQARQISSLRYIANLLDQAPMFMAMLSGPEHRVTFVNNGYLKLIGHRDIVGKTVAEGLPDAADQGYVTLLDQVYLNGEALSAKSAKYEVQATLGGEVNERYIDFVFQPIRDDQDALMGILVQGLDVTERLRDEKRRNALVRLTDTVRDLKTPEEIIFQASLILGETLDVSRVGYGTIDPEAETLTVKRDWNALGVTSLAGTLNLRDYGSFVDDMKLGNVVAVSDIESNPRTSAAAAALHGRGVAAFVNVPIREEGRLVALIFVNNVFARDWLAEDLDFIKEIAERTRTASERMRSEIAVRLSEAKFRTITDAMPQMVWSTRPDGFHDYYNEQWYRFTGVPHGSTEGEGWSELFHPDEQALAWEKWRHSLRTGETYEIEYRLRHHSDQYRWVLGRALPVRGDSGEIVRWMGTCTDIHEQKLTEDAWRRESLRKDEFLAMLAHELRNPLAPISTAAQLIKLPGADAKRIAHAGDIIARQVKHMATIVDDLLDVSRVTRGLVQIQQKTLDLKGVVNSAIEQVQPLMQARRHELLLRLTPQHTMVGGDRTRLVQAISNVLNNAVKYTPPGGRITCSLAVAGDHACIQIADNGIGMAPELIPLVFDIFTQGERTSDRAQGGLGLGLALVKSIVDLHGGTIQATSEGVGKGSNFEIALPLLEAQEEIPISAPTLEANNRVTGKRVLIVDDNQDAGAMLGYMLQTAGYVVRVEEDATSALQATQDFDVEVFILDIGLPDVDGYELARRLRADARTTQATIIALTGYGQPQDRALSQAAGFDYHFVKPADHQELLLVLSNLSATE
jgi:PAS domain S-box-containing protein